MHVDFLTLACLRADLVRLRDARIQQVVMTSETAVALELYAGFRTTLLLDVGPRHARALLQDDKGRRGLERETPLGLLLRKYVRGGRLRGARQPAWERVLLLDIESEAGRSTLVAEIMGTRSNLLLLDEAGTIRECVRHAGAEQNAARVTLPAHPYVPPPPLARRVPTLLSEADWAALLRAADPTQPLARLLPREVGGVSPTLAREIVARAAGDADLAAGEVEAIALVDAVAELAAPLQTGAWQPHVALDEDGEVIAFAPYELLQFETIAPTATVSEAMRRFFATQMDVDSYAAARGRVAEGVAAARKQVERLLYGLRSQTLDPAGVEGLREAGEMLLAYQWQVPKGADAVELPDWEGQPRRITLDPTLSPVENAQGYFARYEKKKRAADEIPPRLAAAEQDLAFLATLENDLDQAEERPEIDAVRDALAAAGLARSKGPRRARSVVRGPRRVLLGEWVALVGRNAQQNDEVTFGRAGSDDLWLHARGVPGSHVILKSAGREVPAEVLERAAALAAYFSQARGSTEVAVDVTARRHVHRISGARPGLVTYRNERTLHVRPAPADELDTE